MSERTNLHKRLAAARHARKMQDKRKPLSGGMERLMHEMKAVQALIEELIALEPAPGKVRVRLGRMKAEPNVFMKMFREFASSYGLAGIDISIESVPVIAKCKCGFEGSVPVMDHVHFVRCPECNSVADILQGDELEIVG